MCIYTACTRSCVFWVLKDLALVLIYRFSCDMFSSPLLAGRLTITDLADVRSVLFSIRHRWYMLGSFLKISSGTLDSIKSQCKNDPSDCLLEMIKTWLSQNEPLPTWENLVHVLSSASICESELAAKICTKYCSEVLKQLSPGKYTEYYSWLT